MSQYDNSNKGGVWKNDNRESEKHPHFKGNAEVGGVQYWVSGWLRNPDGNPNAPAMKFTPKENQPHAQPPQQSPQMAQAKAAVMAEWDKGPIDNFDDDISF
jgi:hypothetical protein